MDRQEFNRLVFEKLSVLNPDSLFFLDESDDSVTIEIVSNSFVGLTVLKRINKAYELISKEIQEVDLSVDFITLTVNEKENGHDEQLNNPQSSNDKSTGYAAQDPL